MSGPTPRDPVKLGREVDLRLTLIERRLSLLNSATSPEGFPVATESAFGTVKLASSNEAKLLVPSTGAAMTPQRVLEAINTFSFAAGREQNAIPVANWNSVRRSGVYSDRGGASNRPPGGANNSYVGWVINTSFADVSSGDEGPIMVEVWEFTDGSTAAPVRKWARTGYTSGSGYAWTAWDDISGASTWAEITGKPSVFPPASHTHTWGDIADAPSTYPPSSHTHTWGEVTGKPLTFPPASHTHTWDDVTGKPATFPPSLHTHAWDDITGKPSTFPPASHTHTASQITDLNAAIDARVPAASETAAGKVELATSAETITGTDTVRAVTPAGLAARTATDARRGLVELATTAEAATGSDTTRAVTPAGLKGVADTKAEKVHSHTSSDITDFGTAVDGRVPAAVPAASETVQGKVELATNAEVQTGTDTQRAVTPAGLAARTATTSRRGIVELATDAETQTGTDTSRAITPANLSARTATESRSGLLPTATYLQAIRNREVHHTQVDDPAIMTPQRVEDAINFYTPKLGLGRTLFSANDLNDATATGFYKTVYGAANRPPGTEDWATIFVTVLDGAYSDWGSGSSGMLTQEAWEVDTDENVVGRRWTRVRDHDDNWYPWVLDEGAQRATGEQYGTVRFLSAERVVINDFPEPTDPPLAMDFYATSLFFIKVILDFQATTLTQGIVRLATPMETAAGTDDTIAVTPAGLRAALDAEGGGDIPPATTTTAGKVRLARLDEATDSAVNDAVVTPEGLAARVSYSRLITMFDEAVDTGRYLVYGPYLLSGQILPDGLSNLALYVMEVDRLSLGTGDEMVTQTLLNSRGGRALYTRIITVNPAGQFQSEAQPWTAANAGSSYDRTAAASMDGDEYLDLETGLKWTFLSDEWFIAPGQLLGSMVGPTTNVTGANVRVGSIVSTPTLPVGQKVRITASFSQYFIGTTGTSLVNVNARNHASDVTASSFHLQRISRAYSPGASAVVAGRAVDAILTTTAAAKVSAAIYTANANTGVYGGDGTDLAIYSA